MKPSLKFGSVMLLLLVLMLAMPSSYGGKIYKWVIDGKTEYRDKPPPSEKGTVEEKKINPDQNVIKMVLAETVGSEGDGRKGRPSNTTTSSGTDTAGNSNKSGQVAGSTGTASTGRTPNVQTSPNTSSTSNTRTSPNVSGGRSGATAGPGAGVTPGPGF